jgi:serine/threonine-protein kinase
VPLNVIHRDVSPHNVMVSYEGHVKLLDFGVAKMDTVDPLTRTGEVKGKTAYMSPEQAMGDPVDRRSDLFAVGAVLYECLAGERMWGSGTDVEMMRKLALETPPRLEVVAPHAPKPLCDLVARLTARAPPDRPATALEVARELRAFVMRASVHAVDATAIASLMSSLFTTEAAERRQLLNDAIATAAPAMRVDVLRRSLAGPTALSAITPPTRRASVPTVSEPPRPSGGPPPTRRGLLASVIGGLVLAAVIASVSVGMRAAAPANANANADASASANANANASANANADANANANADADADASANAEANAEPDAGAKIPSKRPKRPPSHGHVDVDPNPL